MTNCCNANGECTQGRDCPIRRQRSEEANKAFINRSNGLEPDLLDDIVASIKGLLIALVGLVGGLTMVAIVIWGK